jgi:hypothetical protein
MNVTISGYVSFICSCCNKPHTIEAQTLSFDEDTSPASEEDDYIRYISQINTACKDCNNVLQISFDVWEHPEAISNYSYYCEVGANEISCEFTIEHFFDDAKDKLEDVPHEDEPEAEDTNSADTEEPFNETQIIEGYTDQYDDE